MNMQPNGACLNANGSTRRHGPLLLSILSATLHLFAFAANTSLCVAQASPAQALTPEAPRPQWQVLHDIRDFGGTSFYANDNAAVPKTVAGRVIFIGDSDTQYWKQNGGAFFPGKPYLNRGIVGQTTTQMLVRFRQDVIDMRPAAVIIEGGLADIAGFTGPSSLPEIEGNFRSMTDLARFNHIAVILAVNPPATDYPGRKGPEPTVQLAKLNEWVHSYCAAAGCTQLDYYSAMVGPDGQMKPGLSKDGIHPNASGYAIMEPLAEQAISIAILSKRN